jgi:hypothetical protein
MLCCGLLRTHVGLRSSLSALGAHASTFWPRREWCDESAAYGLCSTLPFLAFFPPAHPPRYLAHHPLLLGPAANMTLKELGLLPAGGCGHSTHCMSKYST